MHNVIFLSKWFVNNHVYEVFFFFFKEEQQIREMKKDHCGAECINEASQSSEGKGKWCVWESQSSFPCLLQDYSQWALCPADMRLICVQSLYLYLLWDKRKTLVCRHELTGVCVKRSFVFFSSRGGPALLSAGTWTHLSDAVESRTGFPESLWGGEWNAYFYAAK